MRGRPRTIDYAEVGRLHGEGLTQSEIGRLLGVSQFAISYALSPEVRARCKRYRQERKPWLGACVDCGAPATRIESSSTCRHGRCRTCAALARIDGVADDTLRCSTCDEWKPDEAFSPKPSNPAHRGRDAECKACAATRRRAERARVKASA